MSVVLGLSKGHFDPPPDLGPAGLELCLGDNVVVIEQRGDWCRGYRLSHPNKVGVFPSCYIHQAPPSKYRLMTESLMVAEEWIGEYFRRFASLTKADLAVTFSTKKIAKLTDIEELLSHMLDLRMQLVSGLTSDKFNRAERQLAEAIDFGNKMLGLDLVVRDNHEHHKVHGKHDQNIIQLYRAFNKKNEELLSKTAQFNQARKEYPDPLNVVLNADVDARGGQKSLYLQMKNNLIKGGDEFEFICSLNLVDYEQMSFRQISDNLLLRWDINKMRNNADYLQSLRGLFTDISNSEYSKKLLILIQMIRVGHMDLKMDSGGSQFHVKKSDIFSLGAKKDSTKSTKTTNIRRPYGLCSIQYDPEVSTGAAEDERAFTVYRVPADDDDMVGFTKKVIFGSSSNIQNTPVKELGQLWLQVKTLQGGPEDLKVAYPGLVGAETGCKIVARRNFPDVIMPGAFRNDFYIVLRSGELERCAKANRSIQVEISIRRLQDEVLPLSISLGEGRKESFFRSTVYRDKNPKWSELIKLEIPVEDFDKCHLLFTLRYRSSNETKDKAEKEFGFCWLPLKCRDNLTIQDALYRLIVYKTSDPRRIHSSAYRTLPSCHSELPEGEVPQVDGITYTKDALNIATELCSTKIAQNERLVGLLKWRQVQPEQLKVNLEAIRNQKIKSREIMIFLQDILDALFGIMMDGGLKQFDESIILCLCEIVQLLQNESFRHFRKVLESYLDQFAQTLISTKLLSVLCDILENTRPEEEARKSILRAMEFLFKFIVRSEQLKQQFSEGDDAGVTFDGLELSAPFESLVNNYFGILETILKEDSNVSLLPQGLILSYVPDVIDQLGRVLLPGTLSQRVGSFVRVIGFSKGAQISQERLVEARIKCLHAIVQTQFFITTPNVQSSLADNMALQISALLVGVVRIELTVKVLQDYLVNTASNTACLKENIKRLLIPLVSVLEHFLNRPREETNRCIPNLTSSLITMMDNMSYELHEMFLLRAQKQGEEEKVIEDLLRIVERLYTNEAVFPEGWLQFKLFAARVTLSTIQILSQIIFTHFLSTKFSFGIWCQFFKLCVTFIKVDFIQLENYVPIKRLKIQSEYGDMREAVGTVIREMWLNLGHQKAEFIPELVPDIFRVTLIKVEQIQKDAIFLLFDMINYETMQTRNFSFRKFEEAIVSATDEYFNKENGDYAYVELFVSTLSTLCLRHEKLQYSGLDFIRKMNILMKLLLEYRDVVGRQKDVDDQMMCIEKLLKFFSDEDFGFNRLDLYIEYIYKLFDIHCGAKNYNEAAFTLLEHAKRLSWNSDKQLDRFTSVLIRQKLSNEVEGQIESERDLKEELYERAIKLFERGKMWEEAIKCCKELEKEFEHSVVDFAELATYLTIRARLTAKIVGVSDGDATNSVRSALPYFFVGFFGLGHDEHLANATFIYRGGEYERLEDFADQLASRFPRAKRLNFTHPPDDDVKQAPEQFLQIFLVQPIANIPIELKPPKCVPAKILDFYRFNRITDFTYDRPYQKGEKDKTNEFASLWIERRTYRTYGVFPGILRWFEIEETKVADISPLQNAIDQMTAKNQSLQVMENEFRSGQSNNFQQLQMQLSGTIDPAVSGGFANYDRAFFGSFLESASHDERRQTDQLKELMKGQVPILESLLHLHHDQVVANDEKQWGAFHQNLTRKLEMLKSDVESKYGKTFIRVKHNSLTRRESKRRIQRTNSRPGSTSSSARNSTIVGDTVDGSFMATPEPVSAKMSQGTLPRVKKALSKHDSRSNSQTSTLKRDRSKRISVNIEQFKQNMKDNVKDNMRGTFSTLAKAAHKLQKQMSTDDVNHVNAMKTQSQIELRENATTIRPRRPKSQCRSRPESWGDQSAEKEGLKIFKSSDNIFDEPPPPLPRKNGDSSENNSGRGSSLSSDYPILPPKLPDKPTKKASQLLPPRKPPKLPSKSSANT